MTAQLGVTVRFGNENSENMFHLLNSTDLYLYFFHHAIIFCTLRINPPFPTFKHKEHEFLFSCLHTIKHVSQIFFRFFIFLTHSLFVITRRIITAGRTNYLCFCNHHSTTCLFSPSFLQKLLSRLLFSFQPFEQ